MRTKSTEVKLTKQELTLIIEYLLKNDTPRTIKLRAGIVLLCAIGLGNNVIAKILNIHPNTVVKWRLRWKQLSPRKTLLDHRKPGPRSRPVLSTDMLQKIKETLSKYPPRPFNKWSVRILAQTLDLSIATCHRALKELQLDLKKINNVLQQPQ